MVGVILYGHSGDIPGYCVLGVSRVALRSVMSGSMGASLVYALLYIHVCYVYIHILCIISSRGIIHIMYSIVFNFFSLVILYVAQYILYYLTKLLLIFRFLNPQNSALYV